MNRGMELHRDPETGQEGGWQEWGEVGVELLGVDGLLVFFTHVVFVNLLFLPLLRVGIGLGGCDELFKQGKDMGPFVLGEICQAGLDRYVLLTRLGP